jgi:hypothetical protein
MEAIPTLAQVLRYGNVRQTDSEMVRGVFDGIVARVCVGLYPACSSLDDEAAARMFTLMNDVHGALQLVKDESHLASWKSALQSVSQMAGSHGLVTGRATRLLHDTAALPADEIAKRMSLSLSMSVPANQAAAWVEGFLRGSALILIHDRALWDLIDQWVSNLREDHFTEVVPLLRRTFATFPKPERRQMGERLGPAGSKPAASAVGVSTSDFNLERASKVLPTLKLILTGAKTP